MPDIKRVIILGAGPAGLGAAYHLTQKGYSVSIIDRAHYLGGASASFKIKDYIVDYGPHAFHLKNGETFNLVKDLIGDDYVEVKRKSRLMLDGKNMRYPLSVKEALFNINPILSFKIVKDYLLIRIKNFIRKEDNIIRSFEDWGINAFGYTLYRLAFGSYSEKVWGMSGKQLSRKLAQQKLTKIDLKMLILEAFGIGKETLSYYDMYPRYGIGTLFDKIAEKILKEDSNKIFLDSKIVNIKTQNKMAKSIEFLNSGENIFLDFDYLISTIPLKYLSEFIKSPETEKATNITQRLKYRDLRIIYIVLDKDYYSDIHWIYLLDSHFNFNRMSEQKNLNKESSPPGKTVISLDISCDYNDAVWNMTDEELFKLALSDLSYLGIDESHILDHFTLSLNDVYPIYDLEFEKNMNELIGVLKLYPNVYSTGRQGLFLNNDIHDSIEMGKMAGEFIVKNEDSCRWYDCMASYVKEKLE